MSLIERLKAETPKWFKKIIALSMTLAAAGGALLGVESQVPGLHLSTTLHSIAQYMVVSGIVAAAVAKTAKTDTPNA